MFRNNSTMALREKTNVLNFPDPVLIREPANPPIVVTDKNYVEEKEDTRPMMFINQVSLATTSLTPTNNGKEAVKGVLTSILFAEVASERNLDPQGMNVIG